MSKNNGNLDETVLQIPVEGEEEPLKITYKALVNWFDENSQSLSRRRASETMRIKITVSCWNDSPELHEHGGGMVRQSIEAEVPYMDVKFYEIPKPVLGLIQKLASTHKSRVDTAHHKIDGDRRKLFEKAKKENDPANLRLVWPGQFNGLVFSVQEAMEISQSLAFDDVQEDVQEAEDDGE